MIEIDQLTKRYGDRSAIEDLTFTVRPGRVTGLLGPNGAGKTTTMRITLGLQAPTAGRALIGGRAYRDLDRPLHQVGALLDADGVHPGRTARAHLSWVAQSNGIGRRRVDAVLDLVGLAPVAGTRLHGFSLGMRQRLGIAVALLGDAPVLILDEPVNGLDPEGIVWIRDLFTRLAREGRTILLSSHLMDEVALTADHLLVLGGGRLLVDAPMDEFIDAHARSDVEVRTPAPETLAALLRDCGGTVRCGEGGLVVTGLAAEQIGDRAAAHGIALHQLRTRRATLEDAYLALTRDSVEFGGRP